MRIRGLRRLKTQYAKLRGRLNPGPIVLLYHRVAKLSQDPHLLAVSPQHFEEQLNAMRQHYQVVSLSELGGRLADGGRLEPVVVITFDDGYADNAEFAFPLVKKYGIPATFYLTSGFVGSTKECLQDDLERILLSSHQCPDSLRITIKGKLFIWALNSFKAPYASATQITGWNMESKTDPTPRHLAHREIHNLLRTVHPAERENILEQLRSQFKVLSVARPTYRAMTWAQARMMLTCDLISIGAHTVNHPYLSALTLPEQNAEILESKQTIEKQTGQSVTTFAYPYGTRESYTPATIDLLKQQGFTIACSNFRERIGRQTDLFQIPRLVVRNWNGDDFLKQLCNGRL